MKNGNAECKTIQSNTDYEKEKSFYYSYLVHGMCNQCFHRSEHRKKTDGLLLMNIEALASGESYVPMDCLGKGSVDCPGMGVKVEYVMIGWSLDEDLY